MDGVGNNNWRFFQHLFKVPSGSSLTVSSIIGNESNISMVSSVASFCWKAKKMFAN
jgi:hypothetical protein